MDTDELALEIGDVVIVLEFDDDGWWLCKNTRTLQQGFTPKNFLDAETVGHADATTKTTTTSSARAAVAVSLPDGPSGSSGTNDDAEEVPLTIKQKIAALKEKTSREHISPPVELVRPPPSPPFDAHPPHTHPVSHTDTHSHGLTRRRVCNV